MCDLACLHQLISLRLRGSANCCVIPACDLLTGKRNSSPEEALAAFSTWGSVHGSNANYTRMALLLVDCYFGNTTPAAPVVPALPTPAVKRPRAESTSSSYDSGSEAGRPIPALSSFRAPRFKAPPPASRPYLASQETGLLRRLCRPLGQVSGPVTVPSSNHIVFALFVKTC
jgi:hypothetical protein